MKKFSLAFIVFLAWAVLACWYYTCNIKGLCNNTSTVVTTKKTPITKKQHAFYIIKDSLLYFTNKKDSVFNAYYGFLNYNQHQQLTITAKKNTLEQDSLMVHRVDVLQKALVGYGINPDKIAVDYSDQYFTFLNNKADTNAIAIGFTPISKEKQQLIDAHIAQKTLYADFGKQTFIPDNTLKAYTLEVAEYLKRYPGKKISITGHTDAVGNAQRNLEVGMLRAKNVADYFIENNIDSSWIKTFSKGESEPLAANDTPQNRAKNRRIEINIE